jgi:hypothetical protein
MEAVVSFSTKTTTSNKSLSDFQTAITLKLSKFPPHYHSYFAQSHLINITKKCDRISNHYTETVFILTQLESINSFKHAVVKFCSQKCSQINVNDLGEQLWPWQWCQRKPVYVQWTVTDTFQFKINGLKYNCVLYLRQNSVIFCNDLPG